MPAALEIDREAVKVIALAVGVREAARQYGLNEDTVAAWSAREGWFKKEQEVARVQEEAVWKKQERQGLQASASKTPASIMKSWDGETRFDLAKGLRAGAAVVADMDGQEVLMAAQQVGTLAKTAALVHGWSVNITGSVRLDVLASGAGDSAPVIDI